MTFPLKKHFQKIFSFFSFASFFKKRKSRVEKIEVAETIAKTGEKEVEERKTEKKYFERARTWSDELYASINTSLYRYQLAFFATLGLSCILVLVLWIALGSTHTSLVVVHEGVGGYSWVSTAEPREVPPLNWGREASEIAHYVMVRESYDPLLYADQAAEVKSLSSAEIENEYDLAQSSENKLAPINVLGAKGYRTITIHNVLPLDPVGSGRDAKHPKTPIAQVDFTEVDHFFGQSQTIETPYTALISWKYNGVPSSPDDLLKNWDGFQITKYVVEPVNMDTTHP